MFGVLSDAVVLLYTVAPIEKIGRCRSHQVYNRKACGEKKHQLIFIMFQSVRIQTEEMDRGIK